MTEEIAQTALNAVAQAITAPPEPPNMEVGMLKNAKSELVMLNQRLTSAIEGLDHHIDALLGPVPAPVGELPAQPAAKSFIGALRQEIAQAHNLMNLVEARISIFTKAIHG
jgi:hypothetical protein